MGCQLVGCPRGEIVEVGAEFPVFPTDFSELVGDGVEWGGDGYYARDGGTEDRQGGAFAGCHGLEGMRGEVLDKVRVELAVIPGLREDFRQECERG